MPTPENPSQSLEEDEKVDSKMPFQSKKDKRTAVRVSERLELMKQGRKRQGDGTWDNWDRMYNSIPSREPDEKWQANVFVPFTMSTVLAILAETTSRRTRWKYFPVTKADEPKIDTLEAITDYTLEKGRYDDESLKRDIDKYVYGTSIWKEYFREDKRTIRERKISKDGTSKIETKEIKEFSDVYGKHIPIRNFYLDEKATDIKFARDCCERNIMDVEDFRRMFRKHKNAKKVPTAGEIRSHLSDEDINRIPAGGDTAEDGAYIPTAQMKDNDIEVIEYWNKPRDEHIFVANGVVVVDEPNPYAHKQLPYAMDVCIPKPNCAYGKGIPEVLESSQEELNSLHNQMLDESHLSIHAILLMGGMTIMDQDEYKLRPGTIIPVEDAKNVKQLEMRGVTASHFQMFEEVKQTARVASGLDVRFAENTTPQGSGDTATEVLRLQEASLRRIGLLTKMLEIRCLPRIGMLRVANIKQYYSDPRRVEMVTTDSDNIGINEETGEAEQQKKIVIRLQQEGRSGYDFKELDPADIRANVDVQVIPQSTQPISNAVLAKRLSTALQTVLSFPPAMQIVDVTELFKQYFKRLELPISLVRDFLDEDTQADYELANEENQAMAQGESIPSTVNPSEKHTAVHLAFVYEIDPEGRQTGSLTPQFEQLPQEAKKLIMNHIEGEYSQHAIQGGIDYEGKERTIKLEAGTGTQEVTGGQELETNLNV